MTAQELCERYGNGEVGSSRKENTYRRMMDATIHVFDLEDIWEKVAGKSFFEWVAETMKGKPPETTLSCLRHATADVSPFTARHVVLGCLREWARLEEESIRLERRRLMGLWQGAGEKCRGIVA